MNLSPPFVWREHGKCTSFTGKMIWKHSYRGCLIIDVCIRDACLNPEIELYSSIVVLEFGWLQQLLFLSTLDHFWLTTLMVLSIDLRHLLQFITERTPLSVNKLMECFHWKANFSDWQRKGAFFLINSLPQPDLKAREKSVEGKTFFQLFKPKLAL